MQRLKVLPGVLLCAFLLNSLAFAQLQRPGSLRAPCSKHWPGWSGVKYLFAFGDSYTYTGFNVSGSQPDLANPLGNPPYPGFTSSAGPNWLDFLTVRYNASALLTYNMADGGSTLDPSIVEPWRKDAVSLKDQVGKRWAGTYAKKSKDDYWTSDNTLFAYFVGINDVSKSYTEPNKTIINRLFVEYVSLVQEVYNAGGRNFLFMNVPPIHRTPFTSARGAQAINAEEQAIGAWNKALVNMGQDLPRLLPDSTSFIFDTYSLFNKIMDEPGAFTQTRGLKDTKSFCSAYSNYFGGVLEEVLQKGCEHLYNQYFWINDMHPTYPIHNATAAELGRMLNEQPANRGKACAPDNNNKVRKSRIRRYFLRKSGT